MVKKKRKLFIDMDGTIINSTKAYCDVYNYFYNTHPNFKPAKWWENNKWDLSDVAPLVERCNDIFSNELFFQYAEFIDEDTKNVINMLSYKYELIIVSIGTPENISLKSIWLKKNLPIVKEYIFLCNDHCAMDKSMVDMNGGIFIDDVVSNLDSTNAGVKIVFGKEFVWNKTDKYLRCLNWKEVFDELMIKQV